MDPALWELLRAERDTDRDRVIEAIIRLAGPEIEIPDVEVVSRFGTIATCRIRARDVVAVRARNDVVSLKAARGLGPGSDQMTVSPRSADTDRATWRATDVRRSPRLEVTGRDVAVGLVDWGVDLDSWAFRLPPPDAADHDPAGGPTRFLAFWDQRDHALGSSPEPYGYGAVHDRAEIDRALQGPRPYEQLGYHPAIADRGNGSHGTHVLDIAAGNGRAGPAGVAPEADLVFVHLADRDTGGLANLGDSVRLLEAVDFISRTADSRPWVINLSVGRHGGPHDGTTLTELAFDALLAEAPGRFIVQSTGNYFRSRAHTRGTLAPGERQSFHFVSDPADATPNELEIWYDATDEFAVRIDPPGHNGGHFVGLGERSDLLVGGSIVGRVYHRADEPNNCDNHIDAFLYPIGCAGTWTVTLEARRAVRGRFDAWLERDDACPRCQPRFTRVDANRTTTTGTIANSHLPLVVGAYDGHDPSRPVAGFSSAGPTRDGRGKPDLAAPGVEVLAARSAAIGTPRSAGLLVRKSGTSMATPHVTGAVALCLQLACGRLTAAEIRAAVLASCDPIRSPDPRRRLGRGYLNIPRLVASVRRTLAARYLEPDEREATMDTDDATLFLRAAPATAYREYVYRPRGPLAHWIGQRYDVVARPGHRFAQAPRQGDLLIEVSLGRMNHGRCITLGADRIDRLGSRSRLAQGQIVLRARPFVDLSEPLSRESDGTVEASLDGESAPPGSKPQIFDPPVDFVDQDVVLEQPPSFNVAPGARTLGKTRIRTRAALAQLLGPDLTLLEKDAKIRGNPADATKFQLRSQLRIGYPADSRSPMRVAGSGRFPVVVIAHGMFAGWSLGGSHPSHEGYTYLQNALAVQGIVSVSVDQNAANFFRSIVDMRAEMLLGALDRLRAMDADKTSRFYERLDFDNVGVVGHSRGGEAAVAAARVNAARATNKYGIKAVCALSPTDWTGTLVPAQVLTADASATPFLLVVYPGLDGDLGGDGGARSWEGTGFRTYDRATSDKAIVMIDHAAHNRFNSTWTPDEDTIHPDDVKPGGRLLGRPDHQKLASEYIGGLFRWKLLGQNSQRDLFTGRTANGRGAATSIQWSFGGQRQPLDDLEPGVAPPAGGHTLVGSAVQLMPDVQVMRGATTARLEMETNHQAGVLAVASGQLGPVLTTYRLDLPAPQDWSGFDLLTFRLAVDADLSNPATITTSPKPEYELRIVDDAGKTAVVKSSRLPIPAKPVFHLYGPAGSNENCTVIRLQTISVPVALLTGIDRTVVEGLEILPRANFPKVMLFSSLQLVRL